MEQYLQRRSQRVRTLPVLLFLVGTLLTANDTLARRPPFLTIEKSAVIQQEQLQHRQACAILRGGSAEEQADAVATATEEQHEPLSEAFAESEDETINASSVSSNQPLLDVNEIVEEEVLRDEGKEDVKQVSEDETEESEEEEEEATTTTTTTALSADDSSQSEIMTTHLPAVVETTTTTLLDHHSLDDSTTPTTSSISLSTNASSSSILLNQTEIRKKASQLRISGKQLHDADDFHQAAEHFQAAADALVPLLTKQQRRSQTDLEDEEDSVSVLVEEFATCRLHEALCRLKAEEYELAVEACTHVLEWKVPPYFSDRDDDAASANDDDDSEEDVLQTIAPALRARAFHRRAKAYLEMEEVEMALADARAAAFLGDRKAVALYGRLMRSTSSTSGASASSMLSFENLFASSADMESSSSDSLSSNPSSALLQSLLGSMSQKATSTDEGSASGNMNPFLPFSPLFGLDAAAGAGGQGAGSLAKSVLSSLTKRLEDESTQDSICRFLQSTSDTQLQQYASMAGLSLQPSQAQRLASVMKRATPKAIRTMITATKRGVYAVQLVRKLSQLIQKYRNWIILFCILAWIKSALLRPIPMSKQAAKLAAKTARATLTAI
jgi:hypothetical protein